jgi:CMP-N-acetylneuraminic acid synthetase
MDLNKDTQFNHDMLIYDDSVIPAEEKVLSVTYFLGGKTSNALHLLKKYSLPIIALYDWIYKCSQTLHSYLGNPANRDVNKAKSQWDIIAMIPARGGSKGVPGKALRTVGGISLLERAIAKCRAIEHIKQIIVNTDSPEIADCARQAGADVPFMRPPELATDDALLHDAWVYARTWFQLIEERCGDFWITVSATHPFLDPTEINNALDKLALANRPSLQVVGTMPSGSLEYCMIESDGQLSDLPEVNIEKGKTYYAQCGAFSINCYRPFYHIHPSFRQYVQEIQHPPEQPLAYVLDQYQSHDIDEEGDLYAYECFYGDTEAVVAFSAEDVGQHRIRKYSTNGMRNWKGKHHIVCAIVMPTDEECFFFNGKKSLCNMLDEIFDGFSGRIFPIGSGEVAESVSRHYGLPLIPSELFATVETQNASCHGKAFRLTNPECQAKIAKVMRASLPREQGTALLMVDGCATMLSACTIKKFVDYAIEKEVPALCSISKPVVHPQHLKWLDDEGSIQLAAAPPPPRRQDLLAVQCRDGVLSFWRLGDSHDYWHGFRIPDGEAVLIRNPCDGLRVISATFDSQDKLDSCDVRHFFSLTGFRSN